MLAPGVFQPDDVGNHTCTRSENTTFNENLSTWTCIPPAVSRCENPTKNGAFPEDWGSTYPATLLYAIIGVEEDTIQHGVEFDIVCAENATAVDHRYPLEAWGQEWYPGIKRSTAVCNNGTITRMTNSSATFYPGHPFYRPPGIRPADLRCAMKEKVKLTQDAVSYLRWSEPKMVEAETRDYKWIDMNAILHKTLLKNAMTTSAEYEVNAREKGELQEIPALQRVIKALLDNRMIPRGETMNQDTCKDLERHWLYQIKNSDPFKKANMIGYANWYPDKNEKIGYPLSSDIDLERPVGFKCSYTTQKSFNSFDPYSRATNYRYRDGCYCESTWVGGCPFRAELSPNYQTFGFDAIEVKGVSSSMGAPTNALCWYFTKPDNPEWGYLRSEEGVTFQAPAKNVTMLKRDWIDLKKLAQKARFKKSSTANALR